MFLNAKRHEIVWRKTFFAKFKAVRLQSDCFSVCFCKYQVALEMLVGKLNHYFFCNWYFVAHCWSQNKFRIQEFQVNFLHNNIQQYAVFGIASKQSLVLCRAVAKFWGLKGKNTFLEGEDFAFILCLKQIFLGTTQFWGHKNVWGHDPRMPPWLRAWCSAQPKSNCGKKPFPAIRSGWQQQCSALTFRRSWSKIKSIYFGYT